MARGASTHYRGAVDVKRAADLYAHGWTLRQIAVELGLAETTVSDQLRHAGVTMRRSGPPSHPTSTQQILALRDQGLTWNEVAEQVDMTVSGARSRYRKARPPKSARLGRWQQVLSDALDQNLAIGVRAAVADHLARVPTRTELTAARRAAHIASVSSFVGLLVEPIDLESGRPWRNRL
jgi:transcriptional regulator with XRE-family HTH domain